MQRGHTSRKVAKNCARTWQHKRSIQRTRGRTWHVRTHHVNEHDMIKPNNSQHKCAKRALKDHILQFQSTFLQLISYSYTTRTSPTWKLNLPNLAPISSAKTQPNHNENFPGEPHHPAPTPPNTCSRPTACERRWKRWLQLPRLENHSDERSLEMGPNHCPTNTALAHPNPPPWSHPTRNHILCGR